MLLFLIFSMNFDLCGAFTALVTPFQRTKELEVDEARLREFVNWQIQAGVSGLVVAGTTGESATLSHAEHERVVEIVVEETGGRVPVIAGAGSNNTTESIRLAEHARKVKADAILAVSPYYNKPTQEGLIAHYRKIAEVGLPLILYNVPSRTGRNVEVATTLTLAQHPNIVGIKEACGDLRQVQEICERKPKDFAVLSGEDGQTLEIIRLGGVGAIGVILNEVPAEMSAMIKLALQGNFLQAEKINERFAGLMRLNFVDNNPIDVKFALAEMGKLDFAVRLPLTPPARENQGLIKEELKRLGLA